MAVTWFTTTGIPADSIGVSGDLALDLNGFIWGPKTTTWVGTARSNVGPTGPIGPSGPSSASSRSFTYAGSFWALSSAANTVYALTEVVMSGSTMGQTPAVFGMPRAGSVTGYSLNQVGPVSGTFSLSVLKNTVEVYKWTNIGSGVKSFTGTVAAGTITYVAGDTLQLAIQTTGSGNLQCYGGIEIQTS